MLDKFGRKPLQQYIEWNKKTSASICCLISRVFKTIGVVNVALYFDQVG